MNKYLLLIISISACAASAPLHAAGVWETIQNARKDHTDTWYTFEQQKLIYRAKKKTFKAGAWFGLAAATAYTIKALKNRPQPLTKKGIGFFAATTLTGLGFAVNYYNLTKPVKTEESPAFQKNKEDFARGIEQMNEGLRRLEEEMRRKQEADQATFNQIEQHLDQLPEADRLAIKNGWILADKIRQDQYHGTNREEAAAVHHLHKLVIAALNAPQTAQGTSPENLSLIQAMYAILRHCNYYHKPADARPFFPPQICLDIRDRQSKVSGARGEWLVDTVNDVIRQKLANKYLS